MSVRVSSSVQLIVTSLLLLFQAKENKKNAAEPLINIVYNISRHDDGIIVLNSLQVANLIKQWQSEECFSYTSEPNFGLSNDSSSFKYSG